MRKSSVILFGALVIIFLFIFLRCNDANLKKKEFYIYLKEQYEIALKRLEKEKVQDVADDFRKKVDSELLKLDRPDTVWDIYRRTIVPIRFQEAVENICGKDEVERNTQIDKISLAAVSLGFHAGERCERLYLFSALFKSVMLHRLENFDKSFKLDTKIHERIKGAEDDPDCLIQAGYLFLMEDEKKALLKARGFLSSSEGFLCGLSFIDFLDPGNLDVILEGVKTIVENREGGREELGEVERGDLKVEIEDIVQHMSPIIRQDGESVLKNLELIYRTRFFTGRFALFLLSAISTPWHGSFWQDVALYGRGMGERELALNVMASKKDEGLEFFKNILSKNYEKELNEDFLRIIANLFITKWKNYSSEALKTKGIIPLLTEKLSRYSSLRGKAEYLKFLSALWEKGEVPNQMEDFAKIVVFALEPEFNSCYLQAKVANPNIEGVSVNVEFESGGDVKVKDITFRGVEESYNEKKILGECFADAFELVNLKGIFNKLDYDDEVEKTITREISLPLKYNKEESLIKNEESKAETKKIRYLKPVVENMILGGSKIFNQSEIKKYLQNMEGIFAICSGSAQQATGFPLGRVMLLFEISDKGNLQLKRVEKKNNNGEESGIKKEEGSKTNNGNGGRVGEYFKKCLNRELAKYPFPVKGNFSSNKSWIKVFVYFPPVSL